MDPQDELERLNRNLTDAQAVFYAKKAAIEEAARAVEEAHSTVKRTNAAIAESSATYLRAAVAHRQVLDDWKAATAGKNRLPAGDAPAAAIEDAIRTMHLAFLAMQEADTERFSAFALMQKKVVEMNSLQEDLREARDIAFAIASEIEEAGS